MTSVQNKERSDSGFTLVEFLVAFTLFALVLTLTVGGLRFAVSSWARAKDAGSDVEGLVVTEQLLRELLIKAYPHYQRTNGRDGAVVFSGTAATLSFISTTPRALAETGRSRAQLTLIRRGQVSDVTLSLEPEFSLRSGTAPVSQTVIEKVASMELAYFGEVPGGTRLDWQPQWIGRSRLPKLIRLRIAFAESDRRLWPELIVAPRLDADVTCEFDDLTSGCRGR